MSSPRSSARRSTTAASKPPTSSGKALLFRVLLSLTALIAATAAVLTTAPTLGLDLRGGTQIVLEARDAPSVEANAESTDRAVEVLRRRVDAIGVAEPTLVRSGENRIVVELPGLQEPREAVELIGRTAQLTFHPVLGIGQPDADSPDADSPDADSPDAESPDAESPEAESPDAESPDADSPEADSPEADSPDADSPEAENPDVDPAEAEEIVLEDEDGTPLRLGPAALTGESVDGASAAVDLQSGSGWYVTVDFSGAGRAAWEQMTGEAACAVQGDPTRRIAIVLDNEVITSPNVGAQVPCGVGITGGSTQITGQFTQEEATNLAALIQGGALPVPVEVIEQRTVGPTLGAAAIEASVQAVIIGLILTGLFVIVVYRLMGVLAVIALLCYALIAYAALLTLGATITLPGLAGFVLAVGMAVDANVLVYERAREEFAGRAGLRASVVTGFRRALSAIADSNVTTLLSAGLLFLLASGPVRGFGVTLTIGVLASMFSALVITRSLAELAATRPALARRPAVTGLHTLGRVRSWLAARDISLYREPKRWLAISLLLVVLAGAGIAVRGLNLGVEFTGGRSIQYSTAQQLDVEVAREAVSRAGYPGAVVQAAGEDDISVRTGPIDDAEQETIRDALAAEAGGAEVISDELIGPTLGDELRRNALIALGVALLAQLAYLAVRFRWTFSSGAVGALAANVVVVLGTFAWLGKPLDGVFLAALLTVIGYSVNDSVVVFDRIRETWTGRSTRFRGIVDEAVLQTLPRTVNTGVSTLFVLTALLFLGGDSLSDFALALVIGIVAGTLSTVSVAAPLTTVLQERWPSAPPESAEDKAKRREKARRTDGAVV